MNDQLLVLEMRDGSTFTPKTKCPPGVSMHRVFIAFRKLARGRPDALDGLSQIAKAYVEAVAAEYEAAHNAPVVASARA